MQDHILTMIFCFSWLKLIANKISFVKKTDSLNLGDLWMCIGFVISRL